MASRPRRRAGLKKQARSGARRKRLARAAGVAALACGLLILAMARFARDDGPGSGQPPVTDGYVESSACAGCHAAIWESAGASGMARSFGKLTAGDAVADFDSKNILRHDASDRLYEMTRRGQAFYMRRWQVGFDGGESNVVERRIDYFMGSGYKARTYLSRTERGELLQLPVSWYTEKGGFWAMSPTYDRGNHDGFRRRVQYDCMFCHNAYPDVSPGQDRLGAEPIYGDELPEGIDCQRCHGPGEAHIAAAVGNSGLDAVRLAITNPVRLDPERRLEICLQCHLQSTSRQLPYAVGRVGRGVFSYRPGEPLGDYAVHFDHAPGSGLDGKFEIAHSAYGLMRSSCFQASDGAFTCTSCHDPHASAHGNPRQSRERFREVCENCHAREVSALVEEGRHPKSSNCVDCHMQSRRTDDVVHVTMTDHRIQLPRPARLLRAPMREHAETPRTAYRGDVVPYYPAGLPRGRRDELDIAVAQVKAGSNLDAGIPQLAALLGEFEPPEAAYYFELAEAYRRNGAAQEALPWYERAMQRDGRFLPGLRSQGMALAAAGHLVEAESALRRALSIDRDDARCWHNLGLVLLAGTRAEEAVRAFRHSLEIQDDSPETHNALASALYEAGDPRGAENAFREAVRHRPDYELARMNLARLLAEGGRAEEARHHLRHAGAGPGISAGGGSR